MWQIHQMMQGLFGSLVQGILYSMVSYGLQESMTKTVSWRLSTVYWSWLTLVTGSFIQMYSPNIGTALKGSLEACITKLLYLNWIAGFRAWRVKDNRSRASLAGWVPVDNAEPASALSSRQNPRWSPHQERQPLLLWWICHSSRCLPSAGVQVFTTNNMLL